MSNVFVIGENNYQKSLILRAKIEVFKNSGGHMPPSCPPSSVLDLAYTCNHIIDYLFNYNC